MLGTVNQTIQQTTPQTLNLSLNPGGSSVLNTLATGNVSGISQTPSQSSSSFETPPSVAPSLIGGTSTSNSTGSQINSSNDVNSSMLTNTSGTNGLTNSLLGTNYYNNSSESTGKPEGLIPPTENSQNYKTVQSQNNSSSQNNSILNNLHKPDLGSGATGLTPLSEDNVYNAGLNSISPAMDTSTLLNSVDLSQIGGASTLLDSGAVEGSGLITANAATDTGSLLAGVDTSALGTSQAVSSMGSLLSSVGAYAGGAGAGLEAGTLIGGAVGSPVGGGAAGAAGGAATGALLGTFVLPGLGTAAGAVVGGLAGLLGGVLGGQKPTVGPDGNTSIQGWNTQTNQPNFVSGQDNGGSSKASQVVSQQGWNTVENVVKSMGGQVTGATGTDVGTFKGKFTVGNPGTGYVDSNNPSEKVNSNETANTFSNANQAEAEFIAQQLNYIGQNGKATGLSPDQLKQLANVSYQDVLSGKVPGMQSTQPNNTTSGTSTQPTDYFQQGAQQYGQGTGLAVGGLPKDQGGFVEGAGGPTDDKVPARLSNTEYVMPSDVVHRLGNGDPHMGAKVLTAIIDFIRGPDADKYERPKNVDSPEPMKFGLGGGVNMNTGPSNSECNQEQLSTGGLAYDNNNIVSPTSSTSKALSYANGGMHLNSATQDASYYVTGGMISKGGADPWPNNNYSHGGEVLPNSDNLHAKQFAIGGLVQDNIENDTATQPSLVKRSHKSSKHKAGYDSHGISQELGMEANYAHNYKKGGLVFDGSKPTRRGIFDQNAYAKGGFVVQSNKPMRSNTGTGISPVGPETTYKSGGLIDHPLKPGYKLRFT